LQSGGLLISSEDSATTNRFLHLYYYFLVYLVVARHYMANPSRYVRVGPGDARLKCEQSRLQALKK
jgi:hypothetical protein